MQVTLSRSFLDYRVPLSGQYSSVVVVVVVVVVYFILSRLLYLAFSANLGLLCMPHPSMGILNT